MSLHSSRQTLVEEKARCGVSGSGQAPQSGSDLDRTDIRKRMQRRASWSSTAGGRSRPGEGGGVEGSQGARCRLPVAGA